MPSRYIEEWPSLINNSLEGSMPRARFWETKITSLIILKAVSDKERAERGTVALRSINKFSLKLKNVNLRS